MNDKTDVRTSASTVSRRDIVLGSAGFAAAVFAVGSKQASAQAPSSTPMMPQPTGPSVAFLLDQGATVIDFAAAWDVFAAADFKPFVVAPTKAPITTISGMTITPAYGFEDAPLPEVMLVPAQGQGKDPAKLLWIRRAHEKSRVTLSVCTGSFLLARAGLLDGQPATTHHDAYDLFAKTFPKVDVVRGKPFVWSGKIGTASAGLFGVDLALNAVAKLTSVGNAEQAAAYMGHHDKSWQRQA